MAGHRLRDGPRIGQSREERRRHCLGRARDGGHARGRCRPLAVTFARRLGLGERRGGQFLRRGGGGGGVGGRFARGRDVRLHGRGDDAGGRGGDARGAAGAQRAPGITAEDPVAAAVGDVVRCDGGFRRRRRRQRRTPDLPGGRGGRGPPQVVLFKLGQRAVAAGGGNSRQQRELGVGDDDAQRRGDGAHKLRGNRVLLLLLGHLVPVAFLVRWLRRRRRLHVGLGRQQLGQRARAGGGIRRGAPEEL